MRRSSDSGSWIKGLSAPQYHTTHQVAQLLGVSLPTVVNWVEKGLLEAHRTPGGHRRISPTSLERFAREHDYPLESAGSSDHVDQRRVLVVDDDPDSSEMVSDFLVLRGQCQVEVAEDAVEAGHKLALFRPSVILLRLQMGGIDGLELCRRLLALGGADGVQILAWSDVHSQVLEEQARHAGFAAFLAKPIHLEEILRAIEARLGD